MEIDLKGHRALVTGASRGIGAATVEALASHGAEVAFCARSAEEVHALATKLHDHPGGVHEYVADMSDVNDVTAFLNAVEGDLGTCDIVVNNVGASPSRNFLYMEDEEWSSLFEANVLSAVRCTKHFLPGMRKNKWGRVVMIASMAAKYPDAALIDYAATKAAMVATGKALARKYGRDGVLVNSVLPGLIHTPMWDRTAQEISEATGKEPGDILSANAASVPLGRYGRADEVSNVVLFLVSDAASYVNGSAIDVDGGLGAYVY